MAERRDPLALPVEEPAEVEMGVGLAGTVAALVVEPQRLLELVLSLLVAGHPHVGQTHSPPGAGHGRG